MSTPDINRTPEEDPMTTAEIGVDPTVDTTPITPAEAPVAAPTTTPAETGPRVTTIVWGLVIAAIGAGLLAVALGVTFDLELAVIVLIAAAGLALVGGSLVRGRR